MKILTVVGARPQFVKAAAVSRAIARLGGIEEVMVHTGQHFDSNMSAVFFAELDIPTPRYSLDIHGGGHGSMTGRMLGALEALMVEEAPECVLVYGDTNSTLAGALAAAKLHIPVAHVEAGLRSFNRLMPEEINRVLTDHLSAILLCPTLASLKNLAREGIVANVHHVGDVMYDAAMAAAKAASNSNILDRLGLFPGAYAVATVHRAENTDNLEALTRAFDFLRTHAKDYPVVMPVHPRTGQALASAGLSTDGLIVVDPLGYLDMTRLVSQSRLVLTDSGGLQKEAYFHRVPCITLRDETEWLETVEAGWNRLWNGADHAGRSEIHEYGKGEAAERIVRLLLDWRTSR